MLNPLDVRMPAPEILLPQHALLPRKVQEHLKQAAALNVGVPIGESSFRMQAIDGAVAAAKLKYPELFRNKL